MTFTDTEIDYMASQDLGRLATVAPDGTVQVNPVGFTHNPALGTIDIGGYRMAASRKFRNLATNDRVAFVIDDIASRDPWRVRCLEIRGTAEQVHTGAEHGRGTDGALIRIYPRRIISFGLDNPDLPPHQLAANARDIDSGGEPTS
jgi:pyridoxamine 5'-phosphate oxidase family protein